MDNAKYHLSLPSDVPKPRKMKKQECIDYLESKGVEVEEGAMSVILHECVHEYIQAHKLSACFRLAEAAGNKVLLTTPYHSDFQPIELVWAKVKGNVGRMYDSISNMTIVLEWLKQEFADLEQNGSASI